MAERTDELREDIERQRRSITRTVDQIQNRVSPGRVTARGSFRVRRWLIDTKDRLVGNDRPGYPWQRRPQPGSPGVGRRAEEMGRQASETMDEVGQRASEAASTTREAVVEAPEMVRRQTQGNPLMAGLIAFGGGLLVGSVLPETGVERRATREMEPGIGEAVSQAGETGRHLVEEVKDDAREAMGGVRDTASAAAEEVREEASESARRTRGEPHS